MAAAKAKASAGAPDAVHARVDLEVDRHGRLCPGRGGRQLGNRAP